MTRPPNTAAVPRKVEFEGGTYLRPDRSFAATPLPTRSRIRSSSVLTRACRSAAGKDARTDRLFARCHSDNKRPEFIDQLTAFPDSSG
jgi:hypothetical protein